MIKSCSNCFHMKGMIKTCDQSEGLDYVCIDWVGIKKPFEQKYTQILCDITDELTRASEDHGKTFNSNHEGYAVILEELDELWDEIKKKKAIQDHKLMRAEAIQVASMAVKFILSMEERGDV